MYNKKVNRIRRGKNMIYFAPLEGITTFIYRNIHHSFFGGVDRYYTPFISPTSNHDFKSREKRDILPENNRGMDIVPQILSNHSDEFLYTACCLQEYGYREVNLNVGCPSGTVVSKGRGAGFLGRTKELDQFLFEIFEKCPLEISIKTRLGMEEPEEFEEILKVFNQFPVKELIIHPRTRKDQYKGALHPEWFAYAAETSRISLCFNGDIETKEQYEQIQKKYPRANIMIGRGFLKKPGLAQEIQQDELVDADRIWAFEKALREAYKEIMPGIPALYKMKEVWSFMRESFPEQDRLWKKIKKSKGMADYENVIREAKG